MGQGIVLDIQEYESTIGFHKVPEQVRGQVEKNAVFKVHVPFREGYRFGQDCILCSAKVAPNKFTVSTSFQSANYLVARKNTTMKFDGFRLCDACKKRTTLSRGEWFLLSIAFLLGAGFFGWMLYAKILFCFGCLAWIVVTGAVFFLIRMLIPGRAEAAPASVEVQTEGKHVGENRPTGFIFKFRSKKAADEFASMNNGQTVY